MMLFCGGDEDAKGRARTLDGDAGLEPVDFGGLGNAGLVEQFTRTCITLAYGQGLGEFGLKIMKPA